MVVSNRVVKPKSKRAKRALEEREPKAIENQKTSIMVRGVKCSQMVQNCMKDLNALKKPNSITYNQKNDIRPFEDATKFEFYGRKLDASLFVFGSHNKKRPNNLVFARLYDYNILDMIELGLDAYTSLNEFKVGKVTVGTKPCLLFEGESFADTTNTEMQRLKSMFIDFFRGPEVTNVRLAGIYIFRVELEEIGPSLDLTLRRTHLASDDLMKTACKQVKNIRGQKKIKNISEDVFGTKMGRVHIQSQEITKIQTRKVRALKVSKEEKLEKVEKKKEKAEANRKKAVEAIFAAEDENAMED
ncbi:ribosome production factor 2 homolog [Eurytemora carolleeae]|uniref:ribosome production factor 2 homolog n=1 Tax=Eurytemora carolleeae TaxID=1294199 RepID=UPI000C76537F|nr:ribosome production factor 2 homolog [Eurytemora carolleeae]|eukprot:XP_023336134.1 ribosome production factor 2 homolog [Eurytemora affinis]